MPNNFYGAIALTGGGTGALDAIDGAGLADLDAAFVVTASQMYQYSLDADSGAAESSPDIIAPDTNPGNKRWILVSLGKLTNNLNFNSLKAVAMVCDKGATVPTSPAPVAGQWFLHTPTGRNILLQHDGTNWINIMSVGAMTVYVDKTDGTDSIDKGGAVDSGAFKTIQYAVDRIPGLVGGNVTININGETYSEAVTVQGKAPTGSYTISLIGTLSLQETVTSATVAAGSGATQGTVTKTGAFTGDTYANLLCYFVTDNSYRIIDSHTNDVLTLVGSAPSSTTQDVKVYDWETKISETRAIVIGSQQKAINIKNIWLSGTSKAGQNDSGSDLVFEGCKFSTTEFYINGGRVTFDFCYFTGVSGVNGVRIRRGQAIFIRTKIIGVGSNNGIICEFLSQMEIYGGTIVDNYGSGIYTATNSNVATIAYASLGYVRVRNCTTGIYALEGSTVKYTADNQYSGNTTNENAVSGSYGYID